MAGASNVTLTATDNLGNSGSASFTWSITGAVSVANPGNKSSAAGSAITTLLSIATDTQTGASFTWSATGLPTGLTLNQLERGHHRHAHGGRDLQRHPHRH